MIVGKIVSGSISVGDEVLLKRSDRSCRSVTVVGIEMLRKRLDRAIQGDAVGLLLSNVYKDEISKGDILEK